MFYLKNDWCIETRLTIINCIKIGPPFLRDTMQLTETHTHSGQTHHIPIFISEVKNGIVLFIQNENELKFFLRDFIAVVFL